MRAAAVIYTLIQTANVNYYVDPHAWLTDVQARSAAKRMDELLPCCWQRNCYQRLAA